MDIGGIAFTLVTSIELSSCLYNCVYDIIYIYIQGLHEVLKHEFRQPSKSSDSSFLGVPGASQLPGASERDKAYRKSSSKAQGCRVQRAAPGVCRASRQLEDRSLSVCLFTVLNSEKDSALNEPTLWTFRTCSGLRNNEFWWWSWDHDDWGAQIGGPPKGTRWFTRFIKKNKKNAKRWVPEWLKFGPKRYRRYYARRKHLRGKIGWCLWRRTKKLGQEVDCTKRSTSIYYYPFFSVVISFVFTSTRAMYTYLYTP